MKKSLKRIEQKLINAENLTGDTSHIWINAKNLKGCISSDLYGRISGITGCADNISGNLDDCGLTEEDRENGVDIQSLVQ